MFHLIVFNTGKTPEGPFNANAGCSEGPGWTVDVILNGELIRTGLTLWLPVEPEEEAEYLWYLENYYHTPYQADRAEKCVEIINRYASYLAYQLELDDILLDDAVTPQPQTLLIEVVETTDKFIDQTIHRLFWEILIRYPHARGPEVPCLRASMVGKVIITRSFSSTSSVTDRLSIKSDGGIVKPTVNPRRQTFNVLFVVARNPDPKIADADATFVLLCLMEIQEALRRHNIGCLLLIEVVRPGTFSAFRKHLKLATQEHGRGYYHLVHFDLHGQVKEKAETKDSSSKTLTAGLLFAPKTQNDSHMDFVPAKKIVGLLHDHEIKLVVLNACESANPRRGDSANLAKALLDEGVTNVLAMQCKAMRDPIIRFLSCFYNRFLQGVSFTEAVSDAQFWLSNNTSRRNWHGLVAVHIHDWIVPVVYVNDKGVQVTDGDQPSVNLKLPSSGLLSDPPAMYSRLPTLHGREWDWLALERDLIESGLVSLYGAGGIGKTIFLRWLASAWKATNFVKRIIYIDFAFAPPVNHCTFIERVRAQIDPSSVTQEEKYWNWFSLYRDTEYSQYTEADIAKFIDDLHDYSTVLILDSLDLPLSPPIRRGFSVEQRERLISLIENIVNHIPTSCQIKPLCIFASRNDGVWWQKYLVNMSARPFYLQNIDARSTEDLAMQILHRTGGVDRIPRTLEDVEVLQHISLHVNHNPLALELVLPLCKSMGSLSKVLDSLLCDKFDYHQIRAMKPSILGGDRMFRELDQMSMSTGNIFWFYMQCLTFFWLEGPSVTTFIDALEKVGLPNKYLKETWEGFLVVLYALGACKYPRSKEMPLQDLNPVFTVFLRCWERRYNPGEPMATIPQLLGIVRFSTKARIQDVLSVHLRLGDITVPDGIMRSMINIMNCMKMYSTAAFPIEEWPRSVFESFLHEARTNGKVLQQKRVAEIVDKLLKKYLELFADDQKALKAEDLPFALALSNFLATIYSRYEMLLPGRQMQQIDFSLELINATQARYNLREVLSDLNSSLNASEMGTVFEIKAGDCLINGEIEEGERYWGLRQEMEDLHLAKVIRQQESIRNLRCVPENLNMIQTMEKAWLEIRECISKRARSRQDDWKALVDAYTRYAQSEPPSKGDSSATRTSNEIVDINTFIRSLDEALEEDNPYDLMTLHSTLHTDAMTKGNLRDAEMHLVMAFQLSGYLDGVPLDGRASMLRTYKELQDYKTMSPESQEEFRRNTVRRYGTLNESDSDASSSETEPPGI